ncbi:MAG: DNA-formamidopyrimidine glycosylase [Bacilli bacterium]|nr:DNA-formamidopyrimidine glycosylase [Bacilli bacterium]MDD4077203.1 DNA-formamidopyrimidine glycosylase [Bacilli bacterium]MDD4387674.1 DNA-formamidopyrimidine glycosylase [Bacilli bacterium]
MPELPEVETVRTILKSQIVGKTIKDVLIRYGKIIKNVTEQNFVTLLRNERLIDIGRKGKYLIFIFENVIMLSHLRMEGKYLLKSAEPYSKHEHIVFFFSDGIELRYHDTRKFGTMYLFETADPVRIMQLTPLNRVGLEPFDELLTPEYVTSRISKLNRSIKSLLLDQTIISGLGNIYADEVLFLSKIHPATNVKILSKENIKVLIENSRAVLSKAIAYGGTTVRSFKASDEVSGRFQNFLLVHTKDKCPVCNQVISKIRLSGRGTYFCENCQKRLDITNTP